MKKSSNLAGGRKRRKLRVSNTDVLLYMGLATLVLIYGIFTEWAVRQVKDSRRPKEAMRLASKLLFSEQDSVTFRLVSVISRSETEISS